MHGFKIQGSLKNRIHLICDVLNALDLLSPPFGNGLALLDKVLERCERKGL
jgi:hypothetical protein